MKHKGNLNIKIVTTEPFPIGMAASNRIMSYAKGFAEQNCNVSVHCIKPTERYNKVFNKFSSGTIEGVYYTYSGGKTILNQYFINRRIDNLIGIVKICINILKEKKTEKTDAIIYYSTSTSRGFILFLITRIKNILFLKEESEFPSAYLKDMHFFQRLVFERFHYLLFDGFLIMTNRLIKFFLEEKKIKLPCLHVPMTVDFKRFANLEKKDTASKYIAYCGVLNNEKDGVDLLIDAFAILSKEFPNIKLYLIGDISSIEEQELYLQKIDQSQLSKRILLTGRVSKDEIPKLLCNALILVLPRPANLQTEGGFPTKLGEYLATGNPIIVTRVGEIPNYLTDGLNVFMAEPGSVDSLVCKMEAILLDYPKAMIIGKNGKKVAAENFNYQVQTKNILNFIKSFKKCVV